MCLFGYFNDVEYQIRTTYQNDFCDIARRFIENQILEACMFEVRAPQDEEEARLRTKWSLLRKECVGSLCGVTEDQILSPACGHTHSIRVIEHLPEKYILVYIRTKSRMKG
jgi:hypothetical protein